MQELTIKETQDVSGGLAFVVPTVKIAFGLASGTSGAYALGEALGNLVKMR